MGLSLAMPVRLKIDPRTATAGRDQLRHALRRACLRTAARMAAELESRGDYLVVDLQTPRLKFVGEGLSRLSDEDCRLTADAVRDTILDSLAEVLDSAADHAVPEALAPGERAFADPERLLPGGAYLAPSYDTRPGQRPPDQIVFVADITIFRETFAGFSADLYRYQGDEALARAFRATLTSARQQGAEPSPGLVAGLHVARGPDGDTNFLVLGRYDGDPATMRIIDRFPIGAASVVRIEGTEIKGEQSIRMDFVGIWLYQKLSDVAGAEAHLREAMRLNGEHIVATLTEEHHLSADATAQLRQRVEATAQQWHATTVARARRLNPSRELVHVTVQDPSSDPVHGLCPDVFQGTTSIPIYPILFAYFDPKPKKEEGEGSGQGGGGGQGGDGGAGGAGSGQGGGEGGGASGGGGRAGGAEGGAEGGTGSGAGGSEFGNAGEGALRFRFPRVDGGDPVEIDLSPFHGELSFEELGRIGEALKALMRRIAFRLDMPEGKYPGSFLIAAASVWGGRAGNLSGFESGRSVSLRRLEGNTGALGSYDFDVPETPVIGMLRHLGATVPLMTRMSTLLWDAYQDKANANRLRDYEKGNGTSWHLHFLHRYSPAIQWAISYGFKVACKACLIPVLLASRQEILLRLNNFERYWPVVSHLLLGLLAPQAELEQLRTQLLEALDATGEGGIKAKVAVAYQSWREARRSLMAVLGSGSAQMLVSSEVVHGHMQTGGVLVRTPEGTLAIRDKRAQTWTIAQLEEAIALRAGTAQAIDPLVHKIADLPQVVVMAQASPDMAKAYLKALLEEMLDSNGSVLQKAEGAAEYSFRASKIHEDIRQATVPGTTVAMGGIHLKAHEAIGSSFAGDARYAEGVDRAFSVELGRQAINTFFEFTGTLFLSVICPPLGAAVSVVVAGVHVYQAYSQADIARGILNDDEVLSMADAELDMFLAELEAAFAIIPIAGKVARGVGSGVSTIARRGVREGSRRLAKRAAVAITREMAEQLRYGVIVAVARELVTQQVVGQIMEHAMTPVLQAVMHEISLGTPTGTPASSADIVQQRNAVRRALGDRGAGDKEPPEGAETARKGSP